MNLVRGADAPLRATSAPWHRLIVRPILAAALARLARGRIAVVLPTGERLVGQGARPGAEGTLVLHRWRAAYRLLTGGDIGLAEAYVAGDWSTPDLAALLTAAAENIDALDRDLAASPLARVANRLRHRRRRNSRAGSRRNIAEHYDLGNAFYRLWLDETMTYSSALYAAPDEPLETAQRRKLDRIVGQLALSDGERVLEIGCGWGALAARMAAAGARVVGLTLSTEQLAWGRAHLADQGVETRAELRLEDYRDVRGTFDRVVSVEMIEAVGERYWPGYFRTVRDRLAPDGVAVIQAITIREDRFATYRRNTDFIQRYIFPGGMLPTAAIVEAEAARAGLRLDARESFGPSYAATLAEWRRRFHAADAAIGALGYGADFKRLWDFYLAYCEAGFRTGLLDVAIYRFTP